MKDCVSPSDIYKDASCCQPQPCPPQPCPVCEPCPPPQPMEKLLGVMAAAGPDKQKQKCVPRPKMVSTGEDGGGSGKPCCCKAPCSLISSLLKKLKASNKVSSRKSLTAMVFDELCKMTGADPKKKDDEKTKTAVGLSQKFAVWIEDMLEKKGTVPCSAADGPIKDATFADIFECTCCNPDKEYPDRTPVKEKLPPLPPGLKYCPLTGAGKGKKKGKGKGGKGKGGKGKGGGKDGKGGKGAKEAAEAEADQLAAEAEASRLAAEAEAARLAAEEAAAEAKAKALAACKEAAAKKKQQMQEQILKDKDGDADNSKNDKCKAKAEADQTARDAAEKKRKEDGEKEKENSNKSGGKCICPASGNAPGQKSNKTLSRLFCGEKIQPVKEEVAPCGQPKTPGNQSHVIDQYSKIVQHFLGTLDDMNDWIQNLVKETDQVIVAKIDGSNVNVIGEVEQDWRIFKNKMFLKTHHWKYFNKVAKKMVSQLQDNCPCDTRSGGCKCPNRQAKACSVCQAKQMRCREDSSNKQGASQFGFKKAIDGGGAKGNT